MAGIAGFGTMQLYLPNHGLHEFIDFHATAPAAAQPDLWVDLIEGETRDGFGFILKGRVNDLGYLSVAVPGSLKGYWDAHSKYGVLNWNEVIEPAIALAEQGFPIRPHMHAYWAAGESGLGRVDMIDKLRFSDYGRQVYFRDDGTLKKPGDLLSNPDMAACLRRIAEGGVDEFYRGAIAEQITEDFQRNGGLLTGEDLKGYEVERREPLWGRYRGLDIATNQPPGGGVMILQMLNILENFDLATLGHNSPQYIHVVAEAMKLATVDKERGVGDPRFVNVPIEKLCAKRYGEELASQIKRGELVHVDRLDVPLESENTTHTSVIDEHGGTVAMTHSLGYPSGVITPGLGFMYNGCMNVFDPRPGRPGSLAPGKRRFTAMAPTMVFDNDALIMVLGAPGATAITMAVLQVILNVVDFEMSLTDAVAAPRFCATSDVIDVVNRIPKFVTEELEEMGHPIARSHLSYTLAAVHGIQVSNGEWIGAADPARDGMALQV